MKILRTIGIAFFIFILFYTVILLVAYNVYIPRGAIFIHSFYLFVFCMRRPLSWFSGVLFSMFYLVYMFFFNAESSDISSFDFLISISYIGLSNLYSLLQLLIVLAILIFLLKRSTRKNYGILNL